MLSIGLLDVLDRYGLAAALGALLLFLLGKMAWDTFMTRGRRKLTLAEEYDLYERALAGAKTDEERAELDEVRRSIIRRMTGWRPSLFAQTFLYYCPLAVFCSAWVVLTLLFDTDNLVAVSQWAMFIVGGEAAVNAAGIAASLYMRRMARKRRRDGRHFK